MSRGRGRYQHYPNGFCDAWHDGTVSADFSSRIRRGILLGFVSFSRGLRDKLASSTYQKKDTPAAYSPERVFPVTTLRAP